MDDERDDVVPPDERVRREGKLIFLDGDGRVRALRGSIVIEAAYVHVVRRDGTFTVPVSRVIQIERWTGGMEAPP